MRNLFVVLVAGMLVLSMGQSAMGHEEDLPPGPIHDRHQLMEGIGKQAKVIGDAMKSGKLEPIGPAAAQIQVSAGKALALFPKDSTHPKSRAKPEIWTKWAEFEANMKKLESDAGAVVAASKSDGDVRSAAQTMFGNCKSCHNEFRVPDKE